MENATHPVPGLSPYYIAAGQWEERVFLQNQNSSASDEFLSGDEVRDQIVKVLANYKTGLGRGFRDTIPAVIIHESKKYGYDPLFLTAVIITESSFNNWARSRQGALGLMQILPKQRLRWPEKPVENGTAIPHCMTQEPISHWARIIWTNW